MESRTVIQGEEAIPLVVTTWVVIVCLAGVCFHIWAVPELLRCMDRIAAAMERRAGIEPSSTPNILAPR